MGVLLLYAGQDAQGYVPMLGKMPMCNIVSAYIVRCDG